MSEVAEKMKLELGKLTPHERAELAQFLIRSLDEEDDTDGEVAFDAELARRAQEIKSGAAKGELAEKVFADLREKYA